MEMIAFKKPVSLAGFSLIIPSVSVGNVPQLSVDLLISTLKFESVATIWHPGLVASVGSDPFYSNEKIVCTACELYVNETLKLAAIQFRSTIETKLVKTFLDDLIDEISSLKLNHLYILGTGFDYELHNIANKNTFHFIANIDNHKEVIKMTEAKLLEKDSTGKLTVTGAGFATKLYETIGNRINSTLLVKYVSEGENIYDSQCFLMKLCQFLQIKGNVGPLSYPASWQYVYGPPAPVGLF